MKYKFYSEIPDNEKRLVKSNDIKRIVQQYNGELYLIKDNKCVHKFYYPYKELEDDKIYNLYEDSYIAGSGICYNKFFIFE